ncbi:unnamed protein product [Trifolium pratense]|uniref:Uncharacterized protein n=1 Tax=Trifolium pratense TaxID=57577 RepID=A0ACB0KU81_TRIPR|nr:unnamed protein product [Trifolium pratense]
MLAVMITARIKSIFVVALAMAIVVGALIKTVKLMYGWINCPTPIHMKKHVYELLNKNFII